MTVLKTVFFHLSHVRYFGRNYRSGGGNDQMCDGCLDLVGCALTCSLFDLRTVGEVGNRPCSYCCSY